MISITVTERIEPNKYVNASVEYCFLKYKNIIPSAIETEKKIPIVVSLPSSVRFLTQVIPIATIIVKGTAIHSGSDSSSKPKATPPKAACAKPLPKKLKPRWTTNTP